MRSPFFYMVNENLLFHVIIRYVTHSVSFFDLFILNK